MSKPKFKIGDMVTSLEYHETRVFKLVWFKVGDGSCAIQDDAARVIVKVIGLQLYTPS